MEQGNSKTVYVVQIDNNKDLSDAKKYGQLRAIFGKPRKPYNTALMLSKARKVLQDFQSGDYLLMIGDPALCAVCMTVASEQECVVNLLSWDRDTFQYVPQYWNFGQMGISFDQVED